MINKSIKKLVCYGLSKNLFTKEDGIFITNRILEILNLDSFDCEEDFADVNLEETLKELLDFAVEKGLIDDNITERDLFDTKIMSALMPRPSEVIAKFNALYKESPEAATDYYYNLSCDSDYIRRYRVAKDLKWLADTEYGAMDITVNLSKPEKDLKSILAAKNAPQSGYPKCALCKECEGYAGRINFPARQNHRIIPITLDSENWFLQYSPYVYYNEHCIVYNGEHIPMKVDVTTLRKIIEFVTIFPHYFIGSNAGLPIVGGSILSHEHYQGGHYTFAMTKAPIDKEVTFPGYEDLKTGIVKWPMSVIRITGSNPDRVIELGGKILTAWESYTDEDAFIFAETNGEPHNAVTPIARRRGEDFELDIVLRNNITTEEFPMGVYHPHQEYHHIKKENIGLIEVMGLAVLPGRLKQEMADLQTAILENRDITNDEALAKHAEWAEEIKAKYNDINAENIEGIIKAEIGIVFSKVLEDAGVYKRDEKGQAAFIKFIESVK